MTTTSNIVLHSRRVYYPKYNIFRNVRLKSGPLQRCHSTALIDQLREIMVEATVVEADGSDEWQLNEWLPHAQHIQRVLLPEYHLIHNAFWKKWWIPLTCLHLIGAVATKSPAETRIRVFWQHYLNVSVRSLRKYFRLHQAKTPGHLKRISASYMRF